MAAESSESTEQQTLVTTEPTSASTTSKPAPRVSIQHRASTKRKTGDPTNEAPQRRSFSLRRVATSIMKPERKIGAPPSVWVSLKAIIMASWLNVLLVFIPVSWATHFVFAGDSNKDTIIFVFSFLAIIPLAKLLGFATEELSLRVGQTLAGLLNATLGNAVELIVSIIALTKCELGIVKSSLVGSILSNLLLVLGMCFFAGGIKFQEQGFGVTATQLNSSLLTVSVIGVLLPAAFHFTANSLSDDQERSDILKVSRGVAIVLLFIYASYLIFQLYSHAVLYEDTSSDVVASTPYAARPKRNFLSFGRSNSTNSATAVAAPGAPNSWLHSPNAENGEVPSHPKEEEEEVEEPMLSLWLTIILLVVVTVVVAVTAEFLVDAINGMTDTGGISKEFVGVILLPIVGNAAEHVTAVTVSVKDKLTLSLGVAVGSSIQIALFVIPFVVTLAWIIGKPLTLLFDPYESVALFLAVITVNYVVQDGKSNWLEGQILMLLYVIMAITFWFYPGTPEEC